MRLGPYPRTPQRPNAMDTDGDCKVDAWVAPTARSAIHQVPMVGCGDAGTASLCAWEKLQDFQGWRG